MTACRACNGSGLVKGARPSTLWRGKSVPTQDACGACRGAGVIKPELGRGMPQPSKELDAYDDPASAVEKWHDDLAKLLPSHINSDQWIRIAVGSFRKDKKLKEAAEKNIPSFLSALSESARLGLEPGTEEYYLTPRRVKLKDDHGKPIGYGLEVLGITGYQGIIELMYRAGAVSTVVVENVHQSDRFQYRPGIEDRPIHEIDWDAEDRGPLRLAYAYAIMRDTGAPSKVVVLNKKQIAEIRAKSQAADSEWSPWNTNEPAMWMKSAVRQLRKWVPTSAEYRREQLRAVRQVADEPTLTHSQLSQALATVPDQSGARIDQTTGEILDAELEPEDGWPEVKKPGDDAA